MNIDTHSIQLNKRHMNKSINEFSQLNWLQLNEITYKSPLIEVKTVTFNLENLNHGNRVLLWRNRNRQLAEWLEGRVNKKL